MLPGNEGFLLEKEASSCSYVKKDRQNGKTFVCRLAKFGQICVASSNHFSTI